MLFSELQSLYNGLRRYGATLVIGYTKCGIDCLQSEAVNLTFAHVLNVPASEEVWPGDAIELFYQELFATRLVGYDEVYEKPGLLWDHIREETLRLSDLPECITAESRWKASHDLYCLEYQGSSPEVLYYKGLKGELPHDKNTFEFFCDGSDDEDEEPDTLNSELLLTEEYAETPDSVGFEQNTSQQPSLSPLRRVGTNQPIERKE